MRILTSISFLISLSATMLAQNPHTPSLKINCASCHSPQSWQISEDFWRNNDPEKPKISQTTGLPLPADTLRFSHNKNTNFPLTGRHATVDCRSCHETLVFSEAQSDCISCHVDVHQQTAGNDCARCHTTNHWLVDNIQEIHFNEGFPLTGVHAAVSCEQCHVSESALRFGRNGNDCVSCHLDDFNQTTQPNHQQAGFSTNCIECHRVAGDGWDAEDINHDFFPLTKGHEIQDCAKCHVGGDFSNTPNTCVACHLPDFQGAVNPNHVAAGFSNDCASCHTTDLDWMPAKFAQHDVLFPIYSGSHEGEWNACTDCHVTGDFNQFSCTVCHKDPETSDEHDDVNGYVYQDIACFACHPTGESEGSFDHNATGFPLTGAHLAADCLECHANGFAGTPTDCAACHSADFNSATNPNHSALGLPTDCASCHSTESGWAPAKFDIHNNFYVLTGAHAAIANDCAACHAGDYVNTPNTCNGCHSDDFAAANDPNHAANQLPTDCQNCHTEAAWTPSTFDHNSFFVIAGAHLAVANDCIACHAGGNYLNTPNTCNGCHSADFASANDPNHAANQLPVECETCHTQVVWTPSTFDHDAVYPFTGAHLAVANDCIACHVGGNYLTTPNICGGCHTPDFQGSVNPNHVSLNLPDDCAMCHTTLPDWSPAAFPLHNDFYTLNGAHAAIANDCAACHNGNYTNTPSTCFGCHADDFNSTTDPNHVALQFSTDCFTCHGETAWTPAAFDHDGQYFPIYSGTHQGVWNACTECHANASNYAEFTCTTCHANPETDDQHAGVGGYSFNNSACLACHPTGEAGNAFDHNSTDFPLTGAHLGVDCLGCHANGYQNTPTVCAACHAGDYNSAANPNHSALGLPIDCESCHSTQPGWAPAAFPSHNNFYALNGAHASISTDCAACHNGDY
ncbi:MAG: hypothetical protein AAB316_25425, partial [Bacteroidota bacterium]